MEAFKTRDRRLFRRELSQIAWRVFAYWNPRH